MIQTYGNNRSSHTIKTAEIVVVFYSILLLSVDNYCISILQFEHFLTHAFRMQPEMHI